MPSKLDEPQPPLAPSHGDAGERTRARARETMIAPLDAAPHALIADAAIGDAFAAIAGAALTGVTVDWPRFAAGDALARWLRPADAVIELTRVPSREPCELTIALHTESATRLVERVLGGHGSSAVPSSVGALSDAECGVLAYAAARLCAAHPAGFIVRDVRVAASGPTLAPCIVWPAALQCAFGPLAGLVLLSPALAASATSRHHVELILRDVLVDPTPLAVGDVVTSDRWPLTDTTEGLTGPLRIAAAGTATELDAQLAGGVVRVTGIAPAPRSDEVALSVASRALSLHELASLAAGKPLAFPDIGAARVQLRRGSLRLAEGELVMHRGALGLRVTAT